MQNRTEDFDHCQGARHALESGRSYQLSFGVGLKDCASRRNFNHVEATIQFPGTTPGLWKPRVPDKDRQNEQVTGTCGTVDGDRRIRSTPIPEIFTAKRPNHSRTIGADSILISEPPYSASVSASSSKPKPSAPSITSTDSPASAMDRHAAMHRPRAMGCGAVRLQMLIQSRCY